MPSLLSIEDSQRVCAYLEVNLPQGRRGGFWRELKTRFGSATYLRIWRARAHPRPRLREQDLKRLAKCLKVAPQRLLMEQGERYRSSSPRIFHPQWARDAGWLRAVEATVSDQARTLRDLPTAGRLRAIEAKLRDIEVKVKRPTLCERLNVALGRAKHLRGVLRLGDAPVPSLRWLILQLGIPIVGGSPQDCPPNLGAVGGHSGRHRVIVLTPVFAKLHWSGQREQLAAALWRLLLKDDTDAGRAALEAMRAFFIPSKLGVPSSGAREKAEVRRCVARAYGVSLSLVRDRLDDWAVWEGGRPARSWPTDAEGDGLREPPNPITDTEDYFIWLADHYDPKVLQ